jgi:hypothetical protein
VVDDRLGGFDHDLHSQRILGKAQRASRFSRTWRTGGHLRRRGDLGQRDDEVLWQFAAGFLGQAGQEDVQGTNRANLALVRKRFDPDADKRREQIFAHAFGDLIGSRDGMAIFLVVRAIAVAILEVDAVVFDGLGLQLLEYPVVDRECQPGGRLDLAHLLGIRFPAHASGCRYRWGSSAAHRRPADPEHGQIRGSWAHRCRES